MTEFQSWKQFGEFSDFVIRKFRHILDARNQRFLDAVVQTSSKRKHRIKKGGVLWRAQLGHDWCAQRIVDENDIEVDSFYLEGPHPPERMKPVPGRSVEGRINPKGIPCLYFSTDMTTALTETRPWIGSYVSVAQFAMLRDLTVVDCSIDPPCDPWYAEMRETSTGNWEPVIREPKPEEWGGSYGAMSIGRSRNPSHAQTT